MHFEVLVEDQSGKVALDILIPKIVGADHSFKVIAYKGIGRIPKNMRSSRDASKRILLDNIPRLLRGYGKAYAGSDGAYPDAVILVCDLDDKCLKEFRNQLLDILNACDPRPPTGICIAIEEGEAWLLGDIDAVKAAYPKAKESVLRSYENDSICGTWETLANAVHPGGASALVEGGWHVAGKHKAEWAERIAPRMNVSQNASPSFCYFRDNLVELAGAS